MENRKRICNLKYYKKIPQYEKFFAPLLEICPVDLKKYIHKEKRTVNY